MKKKLTEAKYVIKNKAKKRENSKNPKSRFLCTTMRTHVSYASMKHAYAYTPKNTVLKQQQNNNLNTI